ncbi:MAG: ACP S-malonyltransferase [Planctomycetota bacterium]|jgi:[acyl-carrier-protein] S-malonyltransferase
MKTAFLFPGQGAQSVGMGVDVARAFGVAADLFEKANQILGYDLRKICFDGPAERLNSTTISQPGIFVTSAAILECLRLNPVFADVKPDVTAGLSLGEYTALYAAGVINFEDALVLVQKRGNAMQAAADNTAGGMVSILGLDEEKVTQLCSEAAGGDILVPVNFNCPGQIVLSGEIDACGRAVALAEKYGAIKAVALKVAGAFHTALMSPAADALSKVLDNCEITGPSDIKVIANIDAGYYDNPSQIRKGLVKQLVQPILWQKCMEKLLDEGVESFYEIGPGRVLTGLMKRINRKIKVINIRDLKSLSDFESRACVK